MKRKVYITDLIGAYCGMHYYDESFVEIFHERGYDVEILSNFNMRGKQQYFPIIFNKNKIKSIVLLLFTFVKFVWHQVTHRGSIYVYMCYGEFYDLLMMSTIIFNKKVVCDIHEVHALKYSDSSLISRAFEWYYTTVVRNVIYHSERTKSILEGLKANSTMFYLPHIKYSFKKTYDINNVSPEITNALVSNKTKFLFFGNLSRVKGIDVIVDTFNNLSEDLIDKVEIVIAGKNVDNIEFKEYKSISSNYKVFDRHINDDELVYLYMHTDFVLLPYRKSSQSGIFAMATYFRKPMILTDIPYFKKMLEEYPSFGQCASLDKYPNLIETIILNPNVGNYYVDEDCAKNESKQEINLFFEKFNQYANN